MHQTLKKVALNVQNSTGFNIEPLLSLFTRLSVLVSTCGWQTGGSVSGLSSLVCSVVQPLDVGQNHHSINTSSNITTLPYFNQHWAFIPREYLLILSISDLIVNRKNGDCFDIKWPKSNFNSLWYIVLKRAW